LAALRIDGSIQHSTTSDVGEQIVMRAVMVREFGGIEQAALGEAPKPEPKAGELLLETRAIAVNFVDLVMISGKYQFKPKLPFTPGKLPAGVVAAVGSGVTQLRPGDHAIAMAEHGGFAEFVVMPANQCVKLPPSLSFIEAAAMALVYDTAWFALRDRARIAKGESVLVLGATGGVGLAAIQLAKAFGAKVLAAVASKDKESIVREAGADAVIDIGGADIHDRLRTQVLAETNGQGADVILDMLGGDIFDAAIRALAWRGRLVVIGFASGRIPTLKANYLLVKNIEVSGMQISDYRKRRPADMQACFKEVFDLHVTGKLRPLPTKVYALDEFAAALHDIQDRKQRGRVVLTMGK
jgi:NADPH2:quinone reductase